MAAEFSWAAAADVGMGVAGAISSWGVSSANEIVAHANAEAQALVRDAQNQQRASALSLAASMRSMSYRTALTNAGQSSNDASELIARTQESWTRGNFEQGLKGIEQLGAVSARAAAAGVGGASVRAVSQTMQLQQDRLGEQQAEQQGQMSYELLKARSGIMPAAISRLDASPLSANLDYTPTIEQDGNSGLFGLLAQGLLSKGKSLQVALDSIPTSDNTQLPTGDFSRMDRAWQPESQTIQID